MKPQPNQATALARKRRERTRKPGRETGSEGLKGPESGGGGWDGMGRAGAGAGPGGPSSSGIPAEPGAAGGAGLREGGVGPPLRPSARGCGPVSLCRGRTPRSLNPAPGPARGRRSGPTPAEYSRRAAPLAPRPGRLRARARFRPLFLPEEERGSCLLSSEYVFGVPCLLLPRRRPPPRARLRLRLPVIFVWRPRAPGSTLGGAAAPAPGRSCRRAAGRGAGA